MGHPSASQLILGWKADMTVPWQFQSPVTMQEMPSTRTCQRSSLHNEARRARLPTLTQTSQTTVTTVTKGVNQSVNDPMWNMMCETQGALHAHTRIQRHPHHRHHRRHRWTVWISSWPRPVLPGTAQWMSRCRASRPTCLQGIGHGHLLATSTRTMLKKRQKWEQSWKG